MKNITAIFADGTIGTLELVNEKGASAVAIIVDSENKVMTHESVLINNNKASRHLLTDNYELYSNTVEIMKQRGIIKE